MKREPKLTDAQITKIRVDHQFGVSALSLSEHYGVSRAYVYLLVKNKRRTIQKEEKK